MRHTIEYKNGLIDLNFQWNHLKYGFTFIKISSENDRRFGNAELELYLLGFGIRFCHTHNKKKNTREILKILKTVEECDFVEI